MDPYLSIEDYLSTKTVKLSDAYSVTVTDREPYWDSNLEEAGFTDSDIEALAIETSNRQGIYKKRNFIFKNCTKFTPPVYVPKEELLNFCNTTRVIYVPNTENPPPFELQFFENERQYVGKFIRYCLKKNFYDETVDHAKDSYNPYRYIDQITIDIWDNKLENVVMRHIFKSCRISAYDYDYNLQYDSSNFMTPKISFSFLNYGIDPNPDVSFSEKQSAEQSKMAGYVSRNSSTSEEYRNYRGATR